MMHGYGYGDFGEFFWIGMILRFIISIGVVVGIIWFIVWVVRKGIPGTQERPTSANSAPLEILQIRYAKGDITREEYKEILKDLG